MTYREFQEDVNDWFALRDFCEENNLSVCYNGIDLYEIVDDYWVRESVNEMAGECAWDDIYRLISRLNNSRYSDQSYYDYGDGLVVLEHDDFDPFKDCVLADFRESGLHFDDDDEDAENEEETPVNQWWNRGLSSLYGKVQSDMCCSKPDITGANFSELSHFLNGGILNE